MNRKLGRKQANRDHLFRNLLASLVIYEQIDTTEPKAKEIKGMFDKLIARNKSGDLNAIRNIRKIFFDPIAAEKVIKELLPRYANRNSGFTRSYHLRNRLGDNASMMRLVLVDQKVFVSPESSVKVKTKKGKNEEVDAKLTDKKDTTKTKLVVK